MGSVCPETRWSTFFQHGVLLHGCKLGCWEVSYGDSGFSASIHQHDSSRQAGHALEVILQKAEACGLEDDCLERLGDKYEYCGDVMGIIVGLSTIDYLKNSGFILKARRHHLVNAPRIARGLVTRLDSLTLVLPWSKLKPKLERTLSTVSELLTLSLGSLPRNLTAVDSSCDKST